LVSADAAHQAQRTAEELGDDGAVAPPKVATMSGAFQKRLPRPPIVLAPYARRRGCRRADGDVRGAEGAASAGVY